MDINGHEVCVTFDITGSTCKATAHLGNEKICGFGFTKEEAEQSLRLGMQASYKFYHKRQKQLRSLRPLYEKLHEIFARSTT